jgi:DNA-nicking Smr family endonuclease
MAACQRVPTMSRHVPPIVSDIRFGEAVGPVRPLRQAAARAPIRPRRPAATPVVPREPANAGVEAAPVVEAGAHVAWRRPGVQDRVLRALRGARFSAQAECDLHGCTPEQSQARLAAFLAHAGGRGLRRVRVIHGRGRGVLKSACFAQLRAHEGVLACASAGPADGGAGALRVLLRVSGGAELP